MEKLLKFLKDEEGAAGVEYAVLVSLIIVAAITFIITTGGKVTNAFSKIAGAAW